MRIKLTTNNSYDIVVEKGCFNKINSELKSITKAKKIAIISDDIVFALYGNTLVDNLKNDYEISFFVFKNGEESKNIDTLGDILEFLAENKLDRNDLLIALGGGVVGDITGLSASLYLRGVKFVSIATTLLAQVDSSVGGKTAIDLKAGKNLAGAFYQPSLVLCDINLLDTLKERDFLCGMGEIVKYAIGFDKELYNLLLENNKDNLAQIIERSIEIKKEVVQQDEFDLGERQKLNLGHTFAHAIEKCSNYSINHGEAVAIGLYLICRVYSKNLAQEVLDLLQMYNMKSDCPFDIDEMFEVILLDKKKRADEIALIIPDKIGSCKIVKTKVKDIKMQVKEALADECENNA